MSRTAKENSPMSTKKLSDEEVHPLVIESIRSMTREELQAWIDTAKEAFDRQEALERSYARNGSHAKPKATTRSPRKTTEVVSG